MFDNFSDKITKIFNQISGKKFIEQVKQTALGQQLIKSVSPGQMIVKIVHDELAKLLGSEKSEINLDTRPPAVILMVGLQGAGKTTSAAKLALRLKNKNHKKILLASLDTYRPAAAEQLKILSQKIFVDCDEFDTQKKPIELAKKARQKAADFGYDVLILDTAGRIAIDKTMMQELVEIQNAVVATETLLVVDAMIGQDAINVAKNFLEKLPISGVILTRLDGDSRGGAALTMKAATNCPIKFIGVGEKVEELDEFNPERIASRIVGMGDVFSLVEKAQEIFDEEEMKKAAKKLRAGEFDFNDLLSQIRNMKKMGGAANIINLLPGIGKIKEQLGKMNNLEKEIKLQEALILSMTKTERNDPEILNSSRKHRIAKGAGSTIQEVNRLMKKYKQMKKMMGKMGKIDPEKMKEMMGNFNEGEMSKFRNFI